MQVSQQTKERRAYFRAGVNAFGTYSFIAGLAVGAVVALAGAVLGLSADFSVLAMAGAWTASSAAIGFWLSVTSDKVDRLEVELDQF